MPPKAKPLTLKQKRFAREYAIDGNGTRAARKAGFKDGPGIRVQAHKQITKGNVKSEIAREIDRIGVEFNPARVRRRLDELSHAAQSDGQYGPAVRCEELIGKAAGMWIDQSLQLSGVLSDSHVAALLEHAKRRTVERVDNRDEDDDD